MSNKTLFGYKDINENVSRNAFDLSQKVAFTAKTGELLPVLQRMVFPGDKIKLKKEHFTRTQPLNTSAFTRLKEYFDVFYVPARLLWKHAPAVFTKMYQNPQSASSQDSTVTLGSALPSFPLSTLAYGCYQKNDNTHKSLLSKQFSAKTKNIFGDLIVYDTAKLISYLGYCHVDPEKIGTIENIDQQNPSSPYARDLMVNILPALAYQKIYYDFYRNSLWENNVPNAWNVDYFTGQKNQSVFSPDVIGTANDRYLMDNPFTLRYSNWNKDLFTGVVPSSQRGDVSVVKVDNLGESKLQFPTTTIKPVYPDLPIKDIDGNQVVSLSVQAGTSMNLGILQKKGLTPPDAAPANGSLSADLRQAILQIPTTTLNTLQSLDSQFNILQLRASTAVQRWREIAQSSEQYKDQISKFWNVSVPKSLDGECTWLGGSTSTIGINDVDNTNLQGLYDGTSEAYVAGKGIGSDNSFLCDYDVKEWGYVMVIYHNMPLLEYTKKGVSRELTIVDTDDLPNPTFDKLGLERVPAYVLSNASSLLGVVSTPAQPQYETIGYAPRYYAFKTAVDEVLGAFTTTLPNWVAPIDDDFLQQYWFVSKDNGVAAWETSYPFFKVNPKLLDNIFNVNATSEVAHGWNTDQFLINSFIDFKVVRNLDYDGMPY